MQLTSMLVLCTQMLCFDKNDLPSYDEATTMAEKDKSETRIIVQETRDSIDLSKCRYKDGLSEEERDQIDCQIAEAAIDKKNEESIVRWRIFTDYKFKIFIISALIVTYFLLYFSNVPKSYSIIVAIVVIVWIFSELYMLRIRR